MNNNKFDHIGRGGWHALPLPSPTMINKTNVNNWNYIYNDYSRKFFEILVIFFVNFKNYRTALAGKGENIRSSTIFLLIIFFFF